MSIIQIFVCFCISACWRFNQSRSRPLPSPARFFLHARACSGASFICKQSIPFCSRLPFCVTCFLWCFLRCFLSQRELNIHYSRDKCCKEAKWRTECGSVCVGIVRFFRPNARVSRAPSIHCECVQSSVRPYLLFGDSIVLASSWICAIASKMPQSIVL